MQIEKEELAGILSKFNPWWRGEKIADLPEWKRASFGELYKWIKNPPASRATFLSGARQIGKTTLIMQAIDKLLEDGVPAGNIFYATFDHPLLKLAGIDASIEAWRQREPKKDGVEYVFLDEAQFIRDWGTWVKHQVDFSKQRRIIFTGSATPILSVTQESGVGRWHTIGLTTLSFYEYIQLKELMLPRLPRIKSLKEIFSWDRSDIYQTSELLTPYVAHFHDYLVRGGFPQTALVTTVNQAQKLLREDIIDKALKRDMTAMFGVRLVLELEQTFLYLCLNDGGVLDMVALCNNLDVKRPTAQKFIELLEAAHLIYKIQPFGYGKKVLRGKHKIYLSDPAIAPAVMLKGRGIIDDAKALGVSAESAVLKHLFARYYAQSVRFSYFQGKKNLEVDLVAEFNNEIIPFEVKYRSAHTSLKDCAGLVEFCSKQDIKRGYIITKSVDDFGVIEKQNLESPSILKIPAPLLCYFMGEMEIQQN
ncbi:MAG: putative AAA+ superfamily ATPase [Rickettsiales bacterium]|jgi:predicted AAA+ superfamily ATPase